MSPLKLMVMLALAATPAVALAAILRSLPVKTTPYPASYCLAAATGVAPPSTGAAAAPPIDPTVTEILMPAPARSSSRNGDLRPGLQIVAEKVAWSIQDILYRATVVPLMVGGWYVHHLQTDGALGLDAIPRLAHWRGRAPIDGPNLIGRTYGPRHYGHAVSPTISAGSSFIFSYPLYFGYSGVLLAIIGLWLVDLALIAFFWIARPLILPLLGALTPAALKFVEADYTAVWLTHGYGVLLALAVILSLTLHVDAASRSGRAQPHAARS
jgi:hypothetical protein